MKKQMIFYFVAFCFLFIIIGPVCSEEIIFQLDSQTNYLTHEFGSGTYTGQTKVWAGDVLYSGTKIGGFTISYTKTSYPDLNGYVRDCQIVIPSGGLIGDFLSIKLNHVSIIATKSSADHGIVYAASPAYKSLIGSVVTMTGNTMSIQF